MLQSAQNATRSLRGVAHTGRNRASLPDTRRQEISEKPNNKNWCFVYQIDFHPEETMLHDLYLMSANPWLEAASRRNFEHRALSYSEMAASCKREKSSVSSGMRRVTRTKGLLSAVLEGVLRA
jgi:hypothetical protein